ncbi:hypothetical protein CTI12_AA298200 [Artemisia annua]|uniref:FLZ-type domain-containing protein n=1 Tax=Artemisia annua TaxID=35608 RepID=A0A2U1N7M1_ARTAN|nr:hypothetical protein CTI12_AA298200 [Artemisia annua]
MLRNRSRVVTKQTTPIMQDHQTSSNTSSISPKTTQSPTRSILQRIISPSSLLDTHKHLTTFGGNPFRFMQNPEKPINSFDQNKQKIKNLDYEGIAIILVQENINSNIFNKPNAKKLRVQIPSDPFDQNGSPRSPGDFGIRTRNFYNTGDLTPAEVRSPGYVTGPLSIKEMELSEEYTRVICHGPNPKTTHIYDNCVVDSCCGIRVGSPPPLALESGLSFCQTCKKKIGDGCDIFMYRGEKAFCSEECRCQEMILDGLMST